MAKTDQTKPITISILIISLVFAIINTSGHVKQVAAIIAAYIITGHYEYVNITNILYCILGAVFMFIPINILVRTKTMKSKTRMIKYTYFFIGCSYLLGNMWIIKWLFTMFTGIDNIVNISDFQFQNGYMFTHLSWGSRNEFGAFMNIYIGILYIILGSIIDKKIHFIYKLKLLIAFSGFLLPIVAHMMTKSMDGILWWITKSLPLLLANLSMAVLYAYSQYVPGRWEENICLISNSSDTKNKKSSKKHNTKNSVNNDDTENNTERNHSHHRHHSNSSHSSHHRHQSSSKASSQTIERDDNIQTWLPIDVVHGNDKRIVKNDHKIYESKDSRIGVTISDIVKLDSEKKIQTRDFQSNTEFKNDNSDEGDIVWISKNK